MIHTEHLRKADESYEVRFDGRGNVIHAYFKDGQYTIFPTLDDFIRHVYIGENQVRNDIERTDISEACWGDICESAEYNYYKIKNKYN